MTEKKQDKFWELASAKIHSEATDKELLALEKFLEEEEKRKALNDLEQLKVDLGESKKLYEFSQQKSWKGITSQLRGKTVRAIWSIAKYAAIIVFAFLFGSIITNQWHKRTQTGGFTEVKVPLGQMSEITLYDGTKVCLNSGTTLHYSTDFGKTERQVSLEGEAFFDVTHNGVPFKVKFKGQEVEVLGTRFNVVAYRNETVSRVTLVEGKVNVNNSNGSTLATLNPSEQITIDERSKKAIITKVETNFYVSWTDGKIVFDEEKLVDITNRLERWYNVDIRFTDDAVKDLKFSGTILKNKPFDQIITAFELLLPVKIKYTHVLGDKNVVLISKKSI